MTTEEFIEGHEGKKNKPYKDNAKPPKWTIGIGWNFSDNPLPPHIAAYLKKHGEITDQMIEALLQVSILQAEEDCEDLFPDWENFSENRQMALTDFLFQLGKTRASKFVHAIAAINTGRWEDAGKELKDSNYYKQVPKRAQEVIDLIEAG